MINTISKIIQFIGKDNCLFRGNQKIKLIQVNQINLAKKGDLTFCNTFDSKAINAIKSSRASTIICHKKLLKQLPNVSSSLIFVDNPRRYFLRCVKNFFQINNSPFIDKKAILKSKTIHKSSTINSLVYVGSNVRIGKNCIIHPGVIIHDNTIIGNNVCIHSGAVIGSDGYGFEKDESGNWEKFPQIGNVEIDDDVEIGANSCIMKGTLSATKLGMGSKIGNLVNIGHNVIIGSNCIILPQTVVAGGVNIGNNVFISMGSIIRDAITINANAVIGMGSVVTKNVLKNITVIGNPAKPMKKKK